MVVVLGLGQKQWEVGHHLHWRTNWAFYATFHCQPSLPTLQQTGIGKQATKEANAAIEKEISADSAVNSRKRKKYTNFTDEGSAAIGKHAAENPPTPNNSDGDPFADCD